MMAKIFIFICLCWSSTQQPQSYPLRCIVLGGAVQTLYKRDSHSRPKLTKPYLFSLQKQFEFNAFAVYHRQPPKNSREHLFTGWGRVGITHVLLSAACDQSVKKCWKKRLQCMSQIPKPIRSLREGNSTALLHWLPDYWDLFNKLLIDMKSRGGKRLLQNVSLPIKAQLPCRNFLWKFRTRFFQST